MESIAVNMSTPFTLYAVAEGVVKKSINDGAAWMDANSGLPSVQSVTVAPTDGSRVYGLRCSVTGDSVFVSTDGATTWNAAAGTQQQGRCSHSVAVDPADPDTFYVSAGGGWSNDAVLKSDDAGATFTILPTGLTSGVIPGPLLVSSANAQHVYVSISGGTGGILRSANGGGAFTRLPGVTGDVNALGRDAARGTLFAAMSALACG